MTTTPTRTEPERFTFILEAQPDDVPASIRLRLLLKHALRSLHLRCVSIESGAVEPSQDDTPTEGKQP